MQDTSALLGKYLLEGWTMLGSCCYVHNTVPLMRERGGNKCICVLCDDRYYVQEEGKLLMYETKKSATDNKQLQSNEKLLNQIKETRGSEYKTNSEPSTSQTKVQHSESKPSKKTIRTTTTTHNQLDINDSDRLNILYNKFDDLLKQLESTNDLHTIDALCVSLERIKTLINLF
ncbi:hypothetical protein QTN25_000211 [Entamoeba marina]